MRNPETYQELGDWVKECLASGTDEALQWVADNYPKYIDLRIATVKGFPRDYFKKLIKEGDDSTIAARIDSSLRNNDYVDDQGYHGRLGNDRYWDAYCDHFKITRATLYAARLRISKANLDEVMQDTESSAEDMRKAHRAVKHAEREYHFAKNYKILKEKYQNAALAKVTYDHWMEETFKELADDEVIDMEAMRPEIINFVMHHMRSFNKSREPSRTTVVRWLEGYRDQPIDGVPPERQAEALEELAKDEVRKPK